MPTVPLPESIAGIAGPLLDLVAPSLCLLCHRPAARPRPGIAAAALCLGCARALDRAAPLVLRADALESGFAALPYTGVGRRLVGALKFSRLRPAAELGAALMEARAPPRPPGGTIVPVPPAPLRSARRGIDPATELAAALAARTGFGLSDPLRRRDLRRQRGRGRSERLARPPAIVVRGRAPASVLLIDDVVTTGATLDACARALRAAGAGRVVAITLAAVPPARERFAGATGEA